MSALAAALLSELDDGALDELARALAPRLASLIGGQAAHAERWLTVGEAAEHLACPKSRLYALVSARRVPFSKDGARVLFRASELDEWLANGGGRRP